MKISINVPSYGRAEECDTHYFVPGCVFWVHAYEANKYAARNPGMIVREVPDELRGNVARVRNFILDNTLDDDVSVQIDDDFTGVIMFEGNKRIKVAGDQIPAMIEKYSRIAQEWGVMLWGINITVPDKQSYREYTPFSTQSYVSASFSCFMKGNALRYDERFSLKEDYDMTLQQLNRYRRVMRLNKYFYVKRAIVNQGGCATYRTIDREREQIESLQKKWGSRIVRIDRGKQNHLTTKKKTVDINPVIKSPISGV